MTSKNTLSAHQMRAAEILANNDVHNMTYDQVAETVGVSTKTLYLWRQDVDFIAYQNDIAEKLMDAFIAEAYRELKRIGISGRQEGTRVKALEVALKTRGKLTDVQKVEQTIKDDRSTESIHADIDELKRRLGDV